MNELEVRDLVYESLVGTIKQVVREASTLSEENLNKVVEMVLSELSSRLEEGDIIEDVGMFCAQVVVSIGEVLA